MRQASQNRWIAFAIRRLLGLVLVLLGLVVATFMMVRLIPGDPAAAVLGENATAESVAALRVELGLDRPMHEQFLVYITALSRGDLGNSFRQQGDPVAAIIAQRVGTSLQLAGAALALVLTISVPLGMLLGAITNEGRHPRIEIVFTSLSSAIGALPEFLMATLLVFVFAVWLRWLPVGGVTGWQSLVLPVLAIALRPILTLARIVRLETLNVLASDYIRTARGKQLRMHVIYLGHVMPNVTTAALTIGGLLFAGIVGGAVIVENVFSRPGLGTTLVTAVTGRDYPLVQGLVLVTGTTVVVANAIVDMALTVVNPRSLAKDV